MNKFTSILQSKAGAAAATLLLMAFYVPDAAYLFLRFTHLGMPEPMAWVFYLLKAYSLELVILVCIINQWKWTGRIYSICTFIILLYYYDQFHSPAEFFITVILSFFHSLSIWNLTEIFNDKIESEKDSISKMDILKKELNHALTKLSELTQERDILTHKLSEAEHKLSRKKHTN